MAAASDAQDRGESIERHVGERIKSLRMKHRLSRTEVDELIEQPLGTCETLERGQAFLGPTQLYALARIFGVDPSFFFDGLPLGDIRPLEESTITPETMDLIAAFQHIGDANLRRTIIGLFNAVADDPAYGENITPLR